MNWIVTWIVVNTWAISCPMPATTPDPYGIEPSMMVSYAVACWDSSETKKTKSFDTHEEALKFLIEGEKRCKGGYDCELKDFKLFEEKAK